MRNSEIHLRYSQFLKEGNNFPAWSLHRLTNLMPKTLPRHSAANCIVTLQICSSNQLNLTWGTNLTTGMIRILGGLLLVTWDCDERGITMKPEIVCYCYLPVFLSSFLHPPLSSCPCLSPLFYPSEMW